MTNIVVLGTGMAGFGASHKLNAEGYKPVVYDQATYFGGHTASFRDANGFLFDQGPHISFTKDTRIQDLFAGFINQEYEAVQVKIDNYWRGLKITHPVQLHLNGLPHDLIVEIITDFVKEHDADQRPITNYEDWLIASYGRKFAELFPMQYTRKYHLTTASNMTTDWLGPRMYRPTLQELLRGALAPWNPEVHYITNFRYPAHGGFVSYLKELPKFVQLRLEHKLVTVQPRQKLLRFANGHTTRYDFTALRWLCPCAHCRGEAGQPGWLDTNPTLTDEQTRMVDIHLVGNYAVAPEWADGHHTGYYTFTLMRDRCPCEICAAERTTAHRHHEEHAR